MGAGKGSIAVAQPQVIQGETLTQSRYLTYQSPEDAAPSDHSATMASAHQSGLIHTDQLAQLQQILQHPKVLID